MSVYCCRHLFLYQLSSETFGYTLIGGMVRQGMHKKWPPGSKGRRLEDIIKIDLREVHCEDWS
jgi:hypothetical protein